MLSRAMNTNPILAFAIAASAIACALPEREAATQEQEVLGERVAQPIVNGSPAGTYTEAALVNGPGFICSGAVIAPKIVLTAGHCVLDVATFTVVAPYAGNQSAKGSRYWTDYIEESSDLVNPSTLDVAVIILDKAITLSTYPTLSSAPLPAGSKLVNVGRIQNGQASYSGLFFGAQVTIKSGGWGYPKSYVTEEIIQSGDSGGPVYAGSGAGRAIAAVNSGGGGGTQVLARVDLAYAKIQQLIAANGGSGTSATPAPSPSPTPAPAPAPTCAGTAESEPNDTSNAPDALSGASCGALASSSDVDWYTWSVDGAGIAYDVSLDATSDAQIKMWKWSGSAWSEITGASPTKIAATSSAAGKYVVAVHGGAPQSYRLKLTK
jgi:hypothetical protein